MLDKFESLGKDMRDADDARRESMKAHPDNGKAGFWTVDGIRHAAIVRASSAPEAIAKAHSAGAVDDSWESPLAWFIGPELPDVLSV